MNRAVKRRTFLSLPLLLAGVSACGSGSGARRPVEFTNHLRIPPVLEPTVGADGVRQFELTLQRGESSLLPGKTTRTFGVNGSYLGPTVRARRGDPVRMSVVNQTGETTTLHWHGMRLPARMDGGPHQMIEPGTTWTPEWTIDQPATTCWYHPHLHGKTAMHIYRGLAGMVVIDDAEGAGLPATYGVDDIPLIVQDKRFDSDGSLDESRVDTGTFGHLGDTILINGTVGPILDIDRELVRFRLLNASNARVYRIGFTDDRPFQVIGTDGGHLDQPVTVDRVKLSTGERVEIVVRFREGETVVMNSIGESSDRANDIEEEDFELLRIVAAQRLAPATLPSRLDGVPPPEPPAGAHVRRFTLTGSEINGKDMDLTRIDEVVPAGAHEVWEVVNTTYAHNFHIHEVAFRILDVNGAAPPAYQLGAKDTVFVPKEATVRLAVTFGTFTDPTSPYMYHCHILRHEDKGMMGQFVIVEPGTEQSVQRTIPVPHQHG